MHHKAFDIMQNQLQHLKTGTEKIVNNQNKASLQFETVLKDDIDVINQMKLILINIQSSNSKQIEKNSQIMESLNPEMEKLEAEISVLKESEKLEEQINHHKNEIFKLYQIMTIFGEKYTKKDLQKSYFALKKRKNGASQMREQTGEMKNEE